MSLFLQAPILPHTLLPLSPPPPPGPTDVSEAELQALSRHYLDPSTGLYNYLRFHTDIKAMEREEEGGECSEPPRASSAKVCVYVHMPWNTPMYQADLHSLCAWLQVKTLYIQLYVFYVYLLYRIILYRLQSLVDKW